MPLVGSLFGLFVRMSALEWMCWARRPIIDFGQKSGKRTIKSKTLRVIDRAKGCHTSLERLAKW